MGKKISQFEELTTLDGSELTILAYRGKNYTTKLGTIIALAIGTQSSFGQIEAQVNINKLAIQALNNTVSNVTVNLNNTMGQVSVAINNTNNLTATVNDLLTKIASDEATIAQLVSGLAALNQTVHSLELGKLNEIVPTVVFDTAEW